MINLLITSGCSFTDCDYVDKWPVHLAKHLNVPLSNSGLESQGNGLISRKIIHQVTKALETIPAENLLVGVMWSGPDRHEFYLPGVAFQSDVDICKENPTRISKETNNCWIILNHHWENDYVKKYYGTFHDDIGSLIYTYEHILRVQWFLKLHKIKYFMTTYTNSIFPLKKSVSIHSDTRDLYNQIDFDYFLPIDGQYEWAQQSDLPFGTVDTFHPTVAHNKKFTNEIIIPFLTDKILKT